MISRDNFFLRLLLGLASCLSLLISNKVLDILNEFLKLLKGVILFLELLDLATVGEDSEELEHGLVLIVQELPQVGGGIVLVHVHDGELEILRAEFLGQAVEVGLGPFTLGAVLLGKQKDEALILIGRGVLPVLHQVDEVRAVHMKDISRKKWRRIQLLSLEVSLEIPQLVIIDKLIDGVCRQYLLHFVLLSDDDPFIKVAVFRVLNQPQEEVPLWIVLLDLEVKGDVYDILGIRDRELELWVLLYSALIEELGKDGVELLVLLEVLHTGVVGEDCHYGSREVAVEVNIPSVNEVDALRLEHFLDILSRGFLINGGIIHAVANDDIFIGTEQWLKNRVSIEND